MEKSKQDRINSALKAFLRTEKQFLEWSSSTDYNQVQIKKKIPGNCMRIVRESLAFEIPDLNRIRQYSFNAALAFNYASQEIVSQEEYYITTPDLAAILLSDNKTIYSILNKNKRYVLGQEKGGWYGMQKAMYEIADSDWEGLKESIKYLRTVKKPSSLFHDINIYFDIYDAFLTTDTRKLEQALTELEKPKFRAVRKRLIPDEENVSLITTALAKLGWMHGMEVDVHSEYVPSSILPYEPLESYHIKYKYIQDYYRKLNYDWEYNPVYPELQDWENDEENPDRKKKGLFNKLFKR